MLLAITILGFRFSGTIALIVAVVAVVAVAGGWFVLNRRRGSIALDAAGLPDGAPLPAGGAMTTSPGPSGAMRVARAGLRLPRLRHRRRVALLALACTAALAATVAALWILTPSTDDLSDRVLAVARSERAPVVTPSEVPALLAEAVVAAEDERFFAHHGIDIVGLARAMLYDAGHACLCQGGSTITQQLVKEIYLGGDDSGLRKIVDVVLALKVELHATKAQILADYLTIVPVGFGRWGMVSGACAYFGRHLASLDLAQAALLAGMPEAPSAYDPLLHPAEALARRRVVLAAMAQDGWISRAAADAAQKERVAAGPTAACGG
jgi:membrane peptidoglycan carboxypeptidase